MSIKCCIMAFNASIATELFNKVSTLHELQTKFKPSQYQQALIDFIMSGSGHGIVQAVAGSGKTTTIMQGLNELRKTYGSKKPNSVNETAKMVQFGNVTFKTGTTHSICNQSAQSLEWKDSKGKKVKGYQIWGGKVKYILSGSENGKLISVKNQNDQVYKYFVLPTPNLIAQIEAELYDYIVGKNPSKIKNNQYKQMRYKVISCLDAIVGICKNNGMGLLPSCPMTTQKVEELYTYYSLRPFMNKEQNKAFDHVLSMFWEVCIKALEINNKTTDVWDFDDMFYLTAYYGVDMPKYDFVFIDECQDTNPVTQALILRMLKQDEKGNVIGRAIAVGDKAQAIYGFRGADAQAMATFEKNFNATVLPLSTCYRCAKSIISLVNNIETSHVTAKTNYPPFDYTQISPLTNAPEGLVTPYDPETIALGQASDQLLKDLFVGGTGVVCRKKQPLFSIATKLLTKGIPFNFLGRDDIGKKIIEKFKAYRFDLGKEQFKYKKMFYGANFKTKTGWSKSGQFYYSMGKNNIDEFLIELKKYLEAKADSMENPSIKQSFLDNYDSLEFILNQVKSKFGIYGLDENNVTYMVNSIFSDTSDEDKPVLCSVHKSKGLEFHRVIIPDVSSSFILPFIVAPQWVEQEYNMLYVAYTRAERELVFVTTAGLSNDVDEEEENEE